MAIRFTLLPLFSLVVVSSSGQNFVPNYSFEDHSSCPSLFNQITLSTSWNKSLVNNVAPHHVDYIHTCGSNDFMAPNGFWGFQAPATGQALAAISTKSPLAPNYRENIYAQLIAPLTPGEFYTLSMKMSHTDLTAGATDNLGIRLSTTTDFPIDNFSHLHATSVMSDDVNWVTLSGSIIADSAYAYVGVGNFYTDVNTTAITVCSSCPYVHNEYYIDDICILPHTKNGDPVYCDVAFDPLSTGLDALEDLAVTVQPTLVDASTSNILIRSNNSAPLQLTLVDELGRAIEQAVSIGANGSTTLDVSHLANGTYTLVVKGSAGAMKGVKLLILR